MLLCPSPSLISCSVAVSLPPSVSLFQCLLSLSPLFLSSFLPSLSRTIFLSPITVFLSFSVSLCLCILSLCLYLYLSFSPLSMSLSIFLSPLTVSLSFSVSLVPLSLYPLSLCLCLYHNLHFFPLCLCLYHNVHFFPLCLCLAIPSPIYTSVLF